jgi:hypothetical protein
MDYKPQPRRGTTPYRNIEIPKRPIRKRRGTAIVTKVLDIALVMAAVGTIIYCGIEFIRIAGEAL